MVAQRRKVTCLRPHSHSGFQILGHAASHWCGKLRTATEAQLEDVCACHRESACPRAHPAPLGKNVSCHRNGGSADFQAPPFFDLIGSFYLFSEVGSEGGSRANQSSDWF